MAQVSRTNSSGALPMSIVGANVYRLRVMKIPKVSQDRLAEIAGVALNTLTAIEAARDSSKPQPNPKINTLQAIADGLSVTLDELFREDSATRVSLKAVA